MKTIEVQYFKVCPHAPSAIQLGERYREDYQDVKLILTRVVKPHLRMLY